VNDSFYDYYDLYLT